MKNEAFKDRYGPVALVTGTSSGIGWCFAEALVKRGLDVVLIARRAKRLQKLAAKLENQHGVKAIICQTDLADPGASRAILATTVGLDIGLVINNAGCGAKGGHAETDAAWLADILTVNSMAPMLLTNGFIPRLRARGKGGIILISSVEGLIGVPYSAAYGASKAFVISLGEALWGELTPENIDVLTVCPGPTDTEAAQKQGVDPASMVGMLPPEAVVEFALGNLNNGPTLVSHEMYRDMFAHLTSLPRRDALMQMADLIKNSIQKHPP